MNDNFGKYEIPPTLQGLIDLENMLGGKQVSIVGDFFLGLNFYLVLEKFRYFNTPIDVITFGNIGVDGIHYGFLTDFGTVKDLEVAPIVCVSPMEFDRPTRIVARNLREFLAVNLNDDGLFYNYFKNEEVYLATKRKWMMERENSPYQLSEEEKAIEQKARKYLREVLQIVSVDNPYQCVKNAEMNRQKEICIQTQDQLGVTIPLHKGEKHIPFPIHKDITLDLDLLKEYLFSAPFPSRLAVFRDIQLHYVLQDERELRKIVIDAMINMELFDEETRLSKDNIL